MKLSVSEFPFLTKLALGEKKEYFTHFISQQHAFFGSDPVVLNAQKLPNGNVLWDWYCILFFSNVNRLDTKLLVNKNMLFCFVYRFLIAYFHYQKIIFSGEQKKVFLIQVK